MAQTVVDCCNSALQRVGAASILDPSDNTPEARACLIAFESNRRDELRKHPWNFAITRAVLAPDATPPAFDYAYQFTLPSDCLRLLRNSDYDLDWVVEGRKILSNSGSLLNIRYIRDVVDATEWDSSFYNVLSGALAVDICEKLTQSTSKKQVLIQQYENDVRLAKRMDAFESGPEEPTLGSWIISRT